MVLLLRRRWLLLLCPSCCSGGMSLGYHRGRSILLNHHAGCHRVGHRYGYGWSGSSVCVGHAGLLGLLLLCLKGMLEGWSVALRKIELVLYYGLLDNSGCRSVGCYTAHRKDVGLVVHCRGIVVVEELLGRQALGVVHQVIGHLGDSVVICCGCCGACCCCCCCVLLLLLLCCRCCEVAAAAVPMLLLLLLMLLLLLLMATGWVHRLLICARASE